MELKKVCVAFSSPNGPHNQHEVCHGGANKTVGDNHTLFCYSVKSTRPNLDKAVNSHSTKVPT